MSNILRIATRNSPLALWQAEHVAGQLKRYYPELTVKIIGMTTRGDQILDSPLSRIGGKGLFVKELETAMLEQQADIAVHSMKDVPMLFPEGLHLSVIMEREDPRDAFVSNHYECLKDLPKEARVGTCSLRRQAQLLSHYPHLTICELRGNIHTRLRKLDQGDYDAIILAASGLIRMGLGERIKTHLSIEESLPAVGQGALGIECRTNDIQVNQWLQALRHQETEARVYCERAMNQRMNGGCQVPIGGYATLEQGQLHLRGLVASPDGSPVYYSEASGIPAEAEHLGEQVATDLLQQGGQSILAKLGVITHI